jgi:hypothetical protein
LIDQLGGIPVPKTARARNVGRGLQREMIDHLVSRRPLVYA